MHRSLGEDRFDRVLLKIRFLSLIPPGHFLHHLILDDVYLHAFVRSNCTVILEEVNGSTPVFEIDDSFPLLGDNMDDALGLNG